MNKWRRLSKQKNERLMARRRLVFAALRAASSAAAVAAGMAQVQMIRYAQGDHFARMSAIGQAVISTARSVSDVGARFRP